MKRTLLLTKRNLKEMLIDPVSLIFSIGVPIVMLVFMQLLFGQMDETGTAIFKIQSFAPAIANFGYTFTMLYMALMISGDRGHAFMSRLLVSPVKAYEYLCSFVLSFLPMAIAQTVIFYSVAMIFGLPLTLNTLLSIISLIPAMLFYCACALLIGSIASSEKQAGPICSIVITASGLLGGIWMPLETMGTFLTVCEWLPFYNGVKVAKNVILGNLNGIIPTLIILGYTLIVTILSILIFTKKSLKK